MAGIDNIFSGIGSLIGGGLASDAIGGGINNINSLTSNAGLSVLPYNVMGMSQIPQLDWQLGNNQNIGIQRATDNPNLDFTNFVRNNGNLQTSAPGFDAFAGSNSNLQSTAPNFEDFAKNYNMSEGGKYLLDTATTQQNNSAASKGGFYSGANMRAQTQIAEGVANQDLLGQYQAALSGQSQQHSQGIQDYNAALAGQGQQFSQGLSSWNAMLGGDQQNFNQEQQSYTNLFNQESLGEKAGATQALTGVAGVSALGSLYGANAQAQQSKGSGIGSLGSGLLSLLSL